MAFDGKRLRDLTDGDIRELVNSGVAEHLYLDYKAEQYGDGQTGRKDFLLDICMFANAQGGTLLIGVAEQRDDRGQPTGLPDPSAQLGIEIQNPESLLQAYDARITSCIEERLAIESHSIPVSGGRQVLALRVPDSIRKPHCVRFEGHVYFPSRRERSLYHMDVREIKDMAMRTASQLDRAEGLAKSAMDRCAHGNEPSLIAALVPVFSQNFLVDLKAPDTFHAFSQFRVGSLNAVVSPEFGIEGLRRNENGRSAVLGRDGVLTLVADLRARQEASHLRSFYVNAVDVLLMDFVQRSQVVWSAAAVPAQALLGVQLHTSYKLAGRYRDFNEATVDMGTHSFPLLQIENIFEPAERVIRPLCDVIHQMFGSRESPCFASDGSWRGPNS